MGLNFEIYYRKGVENLVADALSRKVEQQTIEDTIQYMLITQIQPKWIKEILDSYDGDKEV